MNPVNVIANSSVDIDLGDTDTAGVSEMKARASIALRWLLLGALVPAACVSLHSALAEPSPQERQFKKRLYIGGGVGLSKLKPDSSCPCMTITDQNDTAFNLFAGIDISKRFSAEAYVSNLGSASVDFLGQGVGEIDYRVAGVSGLFYFINHYDPDAQWDDEGFFSREGTSLYLRVGAGVLQNSADVVDYDQDYSEHFSAGLGIEHGFRNGLALRLEADFYDTDAQQISASVLKRFGRVEPFNPAPLISEPVPQAPQATAIVDEKPVAKIELPTVYFEFARHELTSQTREKLDAFAEVLIAESDLSVMLSGHADAIDTDEFNMRLSNRRAQATFDYLVALGVAADRLDTQGFGESQPVATNDTEAGRALNRRVEISFR